MTFYETSLKYDLLRFGDVLRGYIVASPKITEPFTVIPHSDYQIEILNPDFVVVLSPCCSIGDSTILLSPLIKLKKSFFDNPYFSSDMTNINRRMTPQQTLPPEVWDKLPLDEKKKREGEGFTYSFLDNFVFGEHEIFSPYFPSEKDKVKYRETRQYMIDFKNTYRISCDKIKRNGTDLTKSKVFQLTVPMRQELRDKIAHFYSRIPQEDII